MKWGSINVVFSPPISAKQYVDGFIANSVEPLRPIPPGSPAPDPYHSKDDRREFLYHLSYSIVAVLDRNVVITSTAVVATVLLAYPSHITVFCFIFIIIIFTLYFIFYIF